MHRLDLNLYFYPKEWQVVESKPKLTIREKFPQSDGSEEG